MTDLSLLRIGASVKLKGGDHPIKPLPLGWQRIAETNAKPSMGRLATVIRVDLDLLLLREQAEFAGVLLGLRGPWGGLDAHRAGGRGHRKGY